MIRKNLMKSLSVIMAAMMAVMTVACGAATENAEVPSAVEETAEEKTLETGMVQSSSIASTESEAGKVETVYVTADANGAVNDIVVSEWLKNVEASSELSDTTELKDIVNVKGTETFTNNGDGTITWNAEGSDIYYQGTTDKELPVSMKITYTLDGKEISPEELAGKSGRVTIRFEYENNAKQTVDVDGKKIEVFTPFAMVSGMMLDADKFNNVEISNGKIISDGGNYVVMGIALPGLKESLDISDDKWDEIDDSEEIQSKLSNYFEITADTSDFELGMTITMASSDILSDFGMNDLSDSDKISDLKDDMGELNDGSNELVDGTKTLKDGTTELRDGVSELFDGTKELSDGTHELYDGTSSLYDGVVKYTDATVQIKDGASALADGTSKAKDGTAKLVNGMKDADLVNNAKILADGSKQISDGINEMVRTLESLTSDDSQLKQSYNMYASAAAWLQSTDSSAQPSSQDLAVINGILSQGGFGTVDTVGAMHIKLAAMSTVQAMQAGGSDYSTAIQILDSNAENEIDAESGELTRDGTTDTTEPTSQGNSQNDTQYDDLDNINMGENTGDNNIQNPSDNSDEIIEDDNEDEEEDADDITPEETEDEPEELEEELLDEDVVLNSTGSGVRLMAAPMRARANANGDALTDQQIIQLISNSSKYYMLVGATSGAANALSSVISSLGGSVGGQASKLGELKSGAARIAAGNAALASGISTIYNGAVALDDGIGELKNGANKLADGTNELVANNGELLSGVFDLKDGARQLDEGATELNDGVRELNDGVIELDDGVQELLDGVIKLDEEGIKKLYEAFDGDLTDFADRMKAIREAGESYTTFGGSGSDIDSSVKFIIKTESIKPIEL